MVTFIGRHVPMTTELTHQQAGRVDETDAVYVYPSTIPSPTMDRPMDNRVDETNAVYVYPSTIPSSTMDRPMDNRVDETDPVYVYPT